MLYRRVRRISVHLEYDDGSQWEVGSQEITDDGPVVQAIRAFLAGIREPDYSALGEGAAPTSTGDVFQEIFNCIPYNQRQIP